MTLESSIEERKHLKTTKSHYVDAGSVTEGSVAPTLGLGVGLLDRDRAKAASALTLLNRALVGEGDENVNAA